jgi:hypothetical protein
MKRKKKKTTVDANGNPIVNIKMWELTRKLLNDITNRTGETQPEALHRIISRSEEKNDELIKNF